MNRRALLKLLGLAPIAAAAAQVAQPALASGGFIANFEPGVMGEAFVGNAPVEVVITAKDMMPHFDRALLEHRDELYRVVRTELEGDFVKLHLVEDDGNPDRVMQWA